jgi:hypothetical protein
MRFPILIIILCVVISALPANESSREIFTRMQMYPFLINYSASNVALGYSSGVTNIWSSSNISGNPALLGYQKGVSYRYSNGDLKWVDVSESVLSYGWKGIGLSLPMPSYKGEFGFVQHTDLAIFGEDVFGPIYEEVDYFNSSQKFSVGFNVYETLTNFNFISPKKRISEFSVGFTLKRQEMEYDYRDSPDWELDFWTQDYGFLYQVDMSKLLETNSLIHTELAIGMHLINPSKRKVGFRIDNDGDGLINEDPFDLLDNDGDGLVDEDRPEGKFTADHDSRFGISVHVNIPLSKVSNIQPNHFLTHFSQDFFSATFNLENGVTNNSQGIEFTLLNIISYYVGDYSEHEDFLALDQDADTRGWKIHLNYKELFTLEYSTAAVEAGSNFFPTDMFEIGFNVNLMSLFGKKS